MHLSIVIPVFNEEANLEELIDRCLAACTSIEETFEIILVDDGSQDRSADMIADAALKNPGLVTGVFLNRNYGQHAAVMAGFEKSTGEIVVTLDADLQNPPEEIPALVRCSRQGYDVVGSVRQDRQDTLFRRISSFIINRAVQKATGIKMTDYGCMLRAYRRSIVDAVLACPERSTFVPVLANSFARTTTEIPVSHDRRVGGTSKYSLLRLISLQFDLLTSMTTFPLRLLSIIGSLMAMTGVGLGMFLIVMRVAYGATWAVDGVFTLFAALFVFIGAQFIAFGLIGEYIGRIYHEVRGRPRYFLRNTPNTKPTVQPEETL